MLVNTRQKDNDIISVSKSYEEPAGDDESHTRQIILKNKKDKKKIDPKEKMDGAEYIAQMIRTGEPNKQLDDKSITVTIKKTEIGKRKSDTILNVNSRVMEKPIQDSLDSLADAGYAGNNSEIQDDSEYTGKTVAKKTENVVKAAGIFLLKELLDLIKAIMAAMGKLTVISLVVAGVVVVIVSSVLPTIIDSDTDAESAIYEYHCYNQHNYTGQANKACGVTAVASALRSLGLQITPDMLEQHNNGHVGLWYGADAWINNHYPVKITRGTVSADTIKQALQHGSLCVVYLHNNCDVSNGSSQWNTGQNVSGGGCHWITLIGYTEAGLIAALDPADGTGNEEYCRPENCEGGTTDKAISMEEVMESCSNLYVITPTNTRTDNEKLLAALIYSEAGASYEDKLAVGTVVMNRLDMQYGGALTLEDVIYAPNQFEGTKTANFRNALANGAPAQCQQVAYEILQEGKRSDKIPSTCVSFMALSISESEMRRRTGCTNFIIIDQRFGW